LNFPNEKLQRRRGLSGVYCQEAAPVLGFIFNRIEGNLTAASA